VKKLRRWVKVKEECISKQQKQKTEKYQKKHAAQYARNREMMKKRAEAEKNHRLKKIPDWIYILMIISKMVSLMMMMMIIMMIIFGITTFFMSRDMTREHQ